MFPEKFDPWMLIGVPIFYIYVAGLVVRDFIWALRRPKP